jgi:hypothetical protein
VGKLTKATGKFGSKLTVNVPAIPTVPGQPDASISRFELNTKARIRKGGKKYPYVVAPTMCKKTWAFKGTFTFEDGTSATATSNVKCKKA